MGRILRRFCVVAVVPAICLGLTGCNSTFDEQTNQQYQAAAGISDRGHEVYVLNALVVTDGKGHGTLVGSLLNQTKTTDKLVSVSATTTAGKTINVKMASPVTLKAQQAVKLETAGAVRLTGSALRAGYYVNVTFTFANAAPVQVSIPVLPDGPVYTSVPVGTG
jgi:copper(I)-binding protein